MIAARGTGLVVLLVLVIHCRVLAASSGGGGVGGTTTTTRRDCVTSQRLRLAPPPPPPPPPGLPPLVLDSVVVVVMLLCHGSLGVLANFSVAKPIEAMLSEFFGRCFFVAPPDTAGTCLGLPKRSRCVLSAHVFCPSCLRPLTAVTTVFLKPSTRSFLWNLRKHAILRVFGLDLGLMVAPATAPAPNTAIPTPTPTPAATATAAAAAAAAPTPTFCCFCCSCYCYGYCHCEHTSAATAGDYEPFHVELCLNPYASCDIP